MSANISVNGIVLRTFNLGEADKIVTLFTEKRGKISLVAKGVRRSRSRFGAVVDPFTDMRITAHIGRGALATITGVEVINAYLVMRLDLQRLRYAYAMLEAIDRHAQDEHAEPRLYKLLRAGLDAIGEASVEADKDLAVLAFDVKLAAITGFLPNLFSCGDCGEKGRELRYFSPSAGGAVCPVCRPGAADAEPMGAAIPGLAWQLLYTTFRELGSVDGGPEARVRLGEILTAHLGYHVQSDITAGELLRRKICFS